MVGKSIVIVANLAPRKMMGLESNGMVLAASPDGGGRDRVERRTRHAGHPRDGSRAVLNAAIDRLTLPPRRRGVRRRPRRGGRTRARGRRIARAGDSRRRRRRGGREGGGVFRSLARMPLRGRRAPAPRRTSSAPTRRPRPPTVAQQLDRAADGARDRRDRARLPLRLLAARRAAGGLSRATRSWRASRDLPVVIHTREAEDDTLRILAGGTRRRLARRLSLLYRRPRRRGRALATGFFLSIPGVVTFPKAESLRAAVASVPADRLLVETDSPYLAPVPFRGKRNEPAHVARVVETLAAARGATGRAGRRANRPQLRRALQAVTARNLRPCKH